MEIPTPEARPVNRLVKKAEKLHVSFALREGKKAKRKSFSETTAFEKLLSLRFVFIAAQTQVGVSFISEETEGRDSLAVGSSRRARKLC